MLRIWIRRGKDSKKKKKEKKKEEKKKKEKFFFYKSYIKINNNIKQKGSGWLHFVIVAVIESAGSGWKEHTQVKNSVE